MADLDEDMDYSEEDPWTPPTPRRVAARAFVMSAVVCRGSIETNATEPEAEALRVRVVEWLGRMSVTDEAEPRELAMLHAMPGTLAPQQAIDAVWLSEGLAVLAWALQWFPLPPHDEEVDPQDVAEALDFLWDDAADLLHAPMLRSHREVKWLGDQLYDVNTRLRQFRRHPIPVDFAAFLSTRATEKGDASAPQYVRLAGSDLAIGGLPIFKAARGELDTVIQISSRRHEAANWLLGQEPLYSQVTADT